MQTRISMQLRKLAAALAAAVVLVPAHAADPATDDWSTFSRFLSILQVVMQSAAKEEGAQSQQAVEDILAGRNAEANALAQELFSDVPEAEREKMISIGRALLVLQQKEAAAARRSAEDAPAIRARKDLAGMGLAYHDKQQYLEAIKRGDVIAVRLFLAGRGVDPGATDIWGTSALELARRNGNPELVALLEAAAKK
ncbi:MAG: hypothetical protein IT515_05895 [Burkholderiales bacterium]|nr:hypothetical protein [Burkholderiales bacterium]